MRHALVMLVVLAGALAFVAVAEEPPAASDPAAVMAGRDVDVLLDAVRRDLAELRFETALTTLENVLATPGLDEERRATALALRAQGHVAFGDIAAAEQDWRLLLALRPAWEPDPSLTPDKAMRRFRAVREATVGTLVLSVTPADARVVVDGRERALGEGGRLPLAAGERIVRVERRGHDPVEQTLEIAPNAETTLAVELVPNARTVVVLTEPAEVEVRIDGELAGRTARPPGRPGPAALTVESLPLGEHVIRLDRPCYRSLEHTALVNVDLLDTGPLELGPYPLAPVRSMLVLRDAPDGAELRLDGRTVARLPAGPVEVCPGAHRLTVAHAGRTVWAAEVELAEEEQRELSVAPRPNLALVGRQPAGLAFAEGYSLLPVEVELAELPTTVEAWAALALPSETDIALAALPDARGVTRFSIYSPVLRQAEPLGVTPPAASRPRWVRAERGLVAVESAVADGPVIVRVLAGSPAAAADSRPGDRVSVVDGRPVTDLTGLRAGLDERAGREVTLGVVRPDGSRVELTLGSADAPVLHGEAGSVLEAAVRAAWAVLDSSVDPEGGAAARANLAVLFGQYGDTRLAVETWRGVRWPARAGVGEGTARYWLGVELLTLGREAEAIEAFRAAAASEATAFTDDGPPVAPAARDRLADLGVRAPRP